MLSIAREKLEEKDRVIMDRIEKEILKMCYIPSVNTFISGYGHPCCLQRLEERPSERVNLHIGFWISPNKKEGNFLYSALISPPTPPH